MTQQEGLKRCKDAGIDPYGPIPNDHGEKMNNTITLDRDSRAAIWASCQPFRDLSLVKDKRSLAVSSALHQFVLTGQPISITVYSEKRCRGNALYTPDARLTKDINYGSWSRQSISISNRGMSKSESIHMSDEPFDNNILPFDFCRHGWQWDWDAKSFPYTGCYDVY